MSLLADSIDAVAASIGRNVDDVLLAHQPAYETAAEVVRFIAASVLADRIARLIASAPDHGGKGRRQQLRELAIEIVSGKVRPE